MGKALWSDRVQRADKRPHRAASGHGMAARFDWHKRISDHVAYALLVYTGLQIFSIPGSRSS